MSRLRWAVRVYLLAVMGAAVGTLAVAAAIARDASTDDLILGAVLFGMAAIAQARPVHLSMKMKITVEDLATFAAALLLGPFVAIVVAGGSTLLGLRFQSAPMRWYNRGFNAAASALGAGAAAVTFALLAGDAGPSLARPLPIAVAAAAKYLTHTGLVDVIVGLQLRRDPLRTWWSVHRRDLPYMATLYGLGALAAVSAYGQPWSMLLFAAPMLFALRGLREGAQVREQTRAAILELADLIDLRDPYTHGHSKRVAAYAERLARRLRLAQSQIDLIRDAARVHDIGKLGTNDMVLLKPGPLTSEEQVEMRKHAELGHRLLRRLPEFWEGAELVLAHHERHDGRGYPRGLAADALPLEVSVISVADTYDAMTTDRPYRKALPWDVVKAEMLRGRDTQWRAVVVDAFVAMIEVERVASRARLAAAVA